MPNFGKFFQPHEFDSPDSKGSGINMKQSTLDKLNVARGIAGIPFHINSGFRTEAHNKKVGGVSDSPHPQGHAADIRTRNGRERWIILNALIKAGFTRIGIGKNYIHADDSPTSPPEVIWDYYK